jgi:DNA polymerase IV (DinB-like DNA polymerase)
MRIVLHIDMDAFFASVEERDKPWLKGKPIVVGSDPEDGRGRGVVSTANYKARAYGIHSAQPISKAWRLSEDAARRGLPRAEFIIGGYRRYTETSRRVMEYLKTESDMFEQASVDEAYLELTDDEQQIIYNGKNKNPWREAEERAKKIKKHILKIEKLTCSIGIGPNKLVAKIAAGVKKPDGLTVVETEDVQKFLDPMPARSLPGIGPKSEAILKREGIEMVQELRARSEERLVKLFGKWGSEMWRKAHGVDDGAVIEEHEIKSIGEQETFHEDTLDANILLARLKAMARSVHGSLAREGYNFKTISIVVRFSDFETKTRAHTLSLPARDTKTIERESLALLLPFLDRRENPKKKRIRLLGVRLEKLSEHIENLFGGIDT